MGVEGGKEAVREGGSEAVGAREKGSMGERRSGVRMQLQQQSIFYRILTKVYV